MPSRDTTKTRTLEDRLLHRYWSATGGRLYGEIPVGGRHAPGDWPAGCEVRRIDAIILTDQQYSSPVPQDAIPDLVERLPHAAVELVEAKKKLNRLVIGQVIAGADMFERQYGIRPAKLTIVCQITDPGLEWVCGLHGICVWISPGEPPHPVSRAG